MSFYDYIYGDYSIKELWDLVSNLLSTPGTRLNSSYWAIERYSTTDILLNNLRNSVVNGWEAKVADKKKAMTHLTTPTTPEERKEKSKGKKKISMDYVERVRARRADTVKEYYHIDKTKTIRKCRKNGVDCRVSDKHYEDYSKADEALNKTNTEQE